jgi:aldose 1-epimerase
MIELSAGALRLVLDPETGGAIAALTRGVPLLRPVADPRLGAQHGRAVAAYPLIPYANRIGWRRFSLGGKSYALDRNFGDHPHTIHGNAWMHPWTVLHAGDRAACLAFDHDPAGGGAREWPFAYHAEQHFALDEDGVSVTLSVRNTDALAWPAGLGLHPYVVRDGATVLRFEADTVWLSDAAELPCERVAVAGNFEFDRGRAVSGDPIDNCFAGWAGEAEIALLDERLSLHIEAATPFDHFQVYTPAGRDFMGLEPVSNMPDAINRIESTADHGLTWLDPGATLSGLVRLWVEGKG